MKWRVADQGIPKEGDRIHTRINDRYVTIFRDKGRLSCLDSICHHTGGPLTLGITQDIEDIGVTVVVCPWHHYKVNIEDGTNIYQAVEVINSKPIISGWTRGKLVQRCHSVTEDSNGVYVELMINSDHIPSDNDACNERCAKDYTLHKSPIPQPI